MSGTIVSQAILFLSSPLLSRTFRVAEFGELANYTAWVTILGLLSSLRYEHAIIVSRDDEAINRVLALTLSLCAVSIAVYALLALLIFADPTPHGYLAAIHSFVLFIPVGVLAICIASPLSQLCVKTGHFKRLGVVSAVQVLTTVTSQLVLGRTRVANGLIIGWIAGNAVAGLYLCWTALDRKRVAGLVDGFRLRTLRATAREHRHFPRYTLPADSISTVSQQFIPVLILALFTPTLAGLYAFSVRVSRVPLLVIATAAGNALRKEGVDALHSERGLKIAFSVTTRGLFAIALVPFITVLAFGPRLFSTVFGHQWADAGHVVQILSPGILVEFVAFPLTVFFLITNSQYFSLLIQLAGFSLLALSFVVGRYLFGDFLVTCMLVSATMVVVNVGVILLARRVAYRATPAAIPPLPQPAGSLPV